MKHKIILSMFIVLALMVPSCSKEKGGKLNILLITIDTLRRDHLGVYGYYRETSPFMDRLAKEGMMFKHVITPIPLTAGSHASILTSLHPLTHNVIMNGTRLHDNVKSMAEVMNENGYYTIGAVGVRILRREKNFSQGFDSFSDKWERDPELSPEFSKSQRLGYSVNESLFRQIHEYLSNPVHRHKPFFIWCHYYDPHGPYINKKHIAFKTRLPKGKPGGINPYDEEIRYTDDCVKQLYEYLGKKGLTRQMITCITADHGEMFDEHGHTYTHVDFYSETTFVPLIFHGYRIPRGKVIDAYVSTMDIATTLLGRINLKFDYPTEGIDLLKWYKKNKTLQYPHRKFLIIGNPKYAKSIQMLGYPYSYILNFDYHYKYWFISGQNTIYKDESRFKPINKKRIKRESDRLIISLPYAPKRGCNYAVLRADIKENKGLSVMIKRSPVLFTDSQQVSPRIKRLNIVYPVTILDYLMVILKLEKGTLIDNFKYAIIPGNELLKNNIFQQKIENKLHKQLLTLRKKKKQDELFDLSNDIEMKENLIELKTLISSILEFRKLIYKVHKYYLRKKRSLLKGAKEQVKLTAKDKKMLKSLGYL